MGLTPKQNRFVAEYLKDLNATQAAIRAGYGTKRADVEGARLLGNVRVRKAVDEAIQRRAERVEVKQDDVLRELMRLMTTDIGQAFDEHGNLKPIHEIPLDCRRAIASIETEEQVISADDGDVPVARVRKLKFWSKTDAIKMAGQHLKLFTEKHEHELGPTLEELVKQSLKGGT